LGFIAIQCLPVRQFPSRPGRPNWRALFLQLSRSLAGRTRAALRRPFGSLRLLAPEQSEIIALGQPLPVAASRLPKAAHWPPFWLPDCCLGLGCCFSGLLVACVQVRTRKPSSGQRGRLAGDVRHRAARLLRNCASKEIRVHRRRESPGGGRRQSQATGWISGLAGRAIFQAARRPHGRHLAACRERQPRLPPLVLGGKCRPAPLGRDRRRLRVGIMQEFRQARSAPALFSCGPAGWP